MYFLCSESALSTWLESWQLGEPLGNEMQSQTSSIAAMTSEGLHVVEAGEPRAKASSADREALPEFVLLQQRSIKRDGVHVYGC